MFKFSPYMMARVALLACLALFSSGCGNTPIESQQKGSDKGKGGGKGGRDRGQQTVPVGVAKVESRDMPVLLNGLGSVDAFNTVVVKTPSPNPLTVSLVSNVLVMPKHVLESAYRAGNYSSAYTVSTAPDSIVTSGPYRLQQYVPGEKTVLTRNPYWFGVDPKGHRLPYLNELDYLIVDLPPGTGDVSLSMAQSVPVAGAVVVTTPQGVSVSDVRKAVAMFRQLNIPVLGVIENMSYFI